MSTRSKRAVIRVCIALGIAELALQAVLVRVIRHGAGVTVPGVVLPVVTVLSGLYYLRSTRGRRAGVSFDCGNGLHAPLCAGCGCECHKQQDQENRS